MLILIEHYVLIPNVFERMNDIFYKHSFCIHLLSVAIMQIASEGKVREVAAAGILCLYANFVEAHLISGIRDLFEYP